MENGAAKSVTEAGREIGAHFSCGIDEPNAFEWGSGGCGEMDSEFCERRDSVGHDAFSTSLVDGRLGAIDDDCAHSSLMGGNGRDESSGACSDNGDVKL